MSAAESSSEAIDRHLRLEGCAPFPVGPRLPRRDNALPPLVASLSLSDRAVYAFDLMNLELEAVDNRVEDRAEPSNRKSPLWRAIRSAIGEWFQRHGDDVDNSKNASAHLDRMYRLAPGRRNGADAEYQKRIRAFQAPRRYAEKPLKPFCAPSYGCRCGRAMDPIVSQRVESDVQIAESMRVAGEDFGDWKLLTGMFLKLVHGHLAIVPNRHFTSRSQRYDAILRVLDGIGTLDSQEHAYRMIPVATSIHLQLEEIAPFLMSSNDNRAWTLDFDRLPFCFNPFTFGQETSTTEQARRVLMECASADASGWVASVADLAREVASALTDPLISADLGFTQDEIKSLSRRYDSDGKERGPLLTELSSADPREVEDIILCRLPVLRSYTHWMRDRGLAFVVAVRRSPRDSQVYQ